VSTLCRRRIPRLDLP